ncbi:MAG: T9SS type A sorting domain-containing protein [Bacteroidia bacterium]|nr:T9SS type A sorting domain-containing protein [Bacteroidia bacterium]
MTKHLYHRLSLIMGLSLALHFMAPAQTYQYLPDSSFDGNGLKSFIFFNNIDRIHGCALQPDEKLVMAGLSKNNSTGSFELCVVRLLVNGDFDSTFNGDGVAYISMGNQNSIGGMTPKVKVAVNGKIVVANSGQGPAGNSTDIMLCRLDSNGVLDPGFNGNGVLFVDMLGTGTQPDMANALDLDATGNIYAVGVTRTGPSPLDNDFAVIKVDTNGQPDTSFDGDGKKLFNPTGVAEFGRGIKVQADGKILFGGTAGSNMYLIRIDSTGAPDNSFNSTGTVSIVFQLASDMGTLDIDALGRIVIAGKLQTSNSNIAVARYRSNGTFDPNFGFNGKYTYNVGGGANVISDIHIQNDYKIILAGYADDSSGFSNYIASRIDTGGVIDLTFNGLGFVSQAIIPGNVDEECGGMAVMADGRIILTGTTVYVAAVNEEAGICRLQPVLATSVNEILPGQQMQAYPNPFGQSLQLVSQAEGDAVLMDTAGRILSSFRVFRGINTIRTADLPAGMYLIRMADGPALKLVKE